MRVMSILLAISLVLPALVSGKDQPAPAAAGAVVGQKAPPFKLPATGGTVSLRSFQGRWLVLAFYPKAFAPRDTAEMTSLREAHEDFRRLNAAVLGVSMDPPAVAERFQREQKLPFALASDTEKTASAAYGAMGLGELFSTRKTVLIDPQGRIAAVIDKVKEKKHGAQVLQALKDLQARPAP